MTQTTVRVSKATRAAIRELARVEGRSMQAVIENAIEEYRRFRFIQNINAAWGALRDKPGEWVEAKAERAAWDQTLTDGLDPHEVWSDDGKASSGPARKAKRK